jgi:3-deoxy-manno-octulosonate cytidylyltransferase (CMP-KDO synthetase)
VSESAPDFCVVIPARHGASRLPGKPLRLLAGRPMIAHVWERAVESGARTVVVATDDERISAAVEAFGGTALLTSPEHASGTDRLAEVAAREGWPDDALVVNLQGDEPCMDPALLRLVAASLDERPSFGLATVATPIRAAGDLFDPNVVKVVVDDAQRACYFSRAPIPWVRGRFCGEDAPSGPLPEGVPFLRHLGLYAYRVEVLRRLCAAAPRPCERAESLEQLRALALGVDIHVSIVQNAPGHGVDTEADLARVEQELAQCRP